MATVPDGFGSGVSEGAVRGAAESRASRPVVARPEFGSAAGGADGAGNAGNGDGPTAGGMGRRRVLVHSSGFMMSPYADIKPPGEDTKTAPRKLWHSSSGSSGG
jgi:error-prone DNA polymerase